MFDRSRLIEALVHEDFFVRSRVLDQFAEDKDPDPVIARKYREGVERYGWEEAYEWENRVVDLTFDDETFEWLVRGILDKSESGPSVRQCQHLLKAFAEGPVALIEQHLDEVSPMVDSSAFGRTREMMGGGPIVSPLDLARFRLRLAKLSIEECKSLQGELFEQCQGVEGFPSQQVKYLECVSDRLADAGCLERARVLDLLENGFYVDSPAEEWMGGHALYQAGLLGIEEAVPYILELFEVDWDWINEQIPEALIAIGTEAVLDEVMDYYPQGSWVERLYLCNVLEKLRFPGKEQRLMKLLESEQEPDLRKDIGVALARYGTSDARKKVLELFLEYPDHPDHFEIAEYLYPVMILSGEGESYVAEWRNRMEGFRARAGGMDEAIFAAAKKVMAREREALVLPFQAPPKVGRNEPCPCGSGKKHKKCCLNR